jgi:hypothetical protein
MLCSPRYWWLSLQPGGSSAEDLHEVRIRLRASLVLQCPLLLKEFPLIISWVAG